VRPDSSSQVIIAGVVSHCAIYHNSLQGKSSYATQVTASTAVEAFGDSFDFIVDDNTISQTRNGIFLWGMSATNLTPQSIDSTYFNYVANNSVQNCLSGIVGISEAWNGWPVANPYPGISYLGNTCAGNTIGLIANCGLSLLADNAPAGDQVDLSVFDHNNILGVPMGIEAEPDNRITNVIAYKNDVNLGAGAVANSVALSLGTGEAPALQQNTYSGGFQTIYGGTQNTAPELEAPIHTLSVQGAAGGSAVSTSLVLWNAGTASLSWSATSNSSWLSMVNSSGGILNENASTLNLSCNPSALAAGVYSGTITVTAGGQVCNYTVTFTVAGNSRKHGRINLL
jgi:hypothetical protein